MLKIKKMETNNNIQSCFAVMSQLRTNIKENEFIETIRQQFENGYQLVAVLSDDSVVAVSGFYIRKNLAWGKFLYIDDLITDEKQRSGGFGKMLLGYLYDEARKNNCEQLHLDSGVQRKDAHRFYEREGMTFASHHYVSQL